MTKELTPLEALEELRHRITNFNGSFHNYKELVGTIETALKALEIIKRYVQLEDGKVYTIGWEWNLTQEEFDLLKEVLK